MKIGVVSPGAPLEIVTNFQSKRKTPTYITFYRGERLFGTDSYALLTRKPDLTFSKLFRLVGKSIDHPHLQELESHYFPYQFFANESGVTSVKQEETYYTPEELLAMMMQHARDVTKNYAEKDIRDCVLTVPSSFSQHERLALYTAANIADLSVLALIEENTAAALNFGMDRNFDEPTTVLFYNMGASSVQVSIVVFSSTTVKETSTKNKTVSQFEVVGKAWDTHLGGFSFDVRLAELLADRFNEAWVKKASKKGKVEVDPKDYDVRKFSRPMARLRAEALKLKEVLSGNLEFPVKIEQLHADVDLITKVTREEFEERCKDLIDRVTESITGAMDMAEITLQNITAVELIGGGVRVPKVKQTLDTFFRAGDLELGQHLNGDEAMALGAAFRGANLSTAFRVRKVGMVDTSSFSIALNLEDAPQQPEATGLLNSVLNAFSDDKEGSKSDSDVKEIWSKRVSLFPRRSPVPSKVKTVTFSHDKDIVCRLEYDSDEITSRLLPPSDDKLIAIYNISGISEFIKDNADKGITGTPKVSLSFLLDASGLVSLSKAEIMMELPVEPEPPSSITPEDSSESETSDTSSVKDSSSDSSTAEETDEKKETATEDVEPPPVEEATKKTSKKKKEKKDKDRLLKRALKIAYGYDATTPAQYTPEMVEYSRSRLLHLEEVDRSRRAQEAALNSLEGYILSTKSKILEDEEDLSKVSTDEERSGVVTLCDEIEDWLYGDGRGATVVAYKEKEREVSKVAESIFRRYSELTSRPQAVAKARKQLEGIKKRVAKWPDTMPQITSNETEKMIDLVDKVEHWIDEKEAEQAKKSPFEEPEFLSSDVVSQMKPVASLLDRFLKRPKPVPPKVNT